MAPAPSSDLGEPHLGAVVEVVALVVGVRAVVVVDVDEEVVVLVEDVPLVEGDLDDGLEVVGPAGGGDLGAGAEPPEPPARCRRGSAWRPIR